MNTLKKYKNILLVDDDPIINHINKRLIELNDLAEEIISYTSPEEALEHLKNSICFPDILFLDIQMPGMNGFEFLEEYEKLTNILKDQTKVIVLSSTDLPEEVDRIRSNKNVYEFMGKPLNAEHLKSLKEQL